MPQRGKNAGWRHNNGKQVTETKHKVAEGYLLLLHAVGLCTRAAVPPFLAGGPEKLHKYEHAEKERPRKNQGN